MSARRGIALALVAGLALAGCGDDEGPQIPEGQSLELRNLLQDVKRQVEAGNACNVRDSTLTSLEARVGALPDDLDEDVRQTLDDGIGNLRELVDEECAQAPEEPEEEQTDTQEETAPTLPPETETAPPETETAPEIPPEQDDDGDDDGGDGGDGGGPPGGEGPGSGGIGPGAQKQEGRTGRRGP